MVGDHSGHPFGAFVIDLEGDEITLVDADQGRVGSERQFEFGLVVDLDEHVESDLGREPMEVDQLGTIESCRDQQHTVGTHQAGVDDVQRD